MMLGKWLDRFSEKSFQRCERSGTIGSCYTPADRFNDHHSGREKLYNAVFDIEICSLRQLFFEFLVCIPRCLSSVTTEYERGMRWI